VPHPKRAFRVLGGIPQALPNNLSSRAKRSRVEGSAVAFRQPSTTRGCPIQNALFAFWVGYHKPPPNRAVIPSEVEGSAVAFSSVPARFKVCPIQNALLAFWVGYHKPQPKKKVVNPRVPYQGASSFARTTFGGSVGLQPHEKGSWIQCGFSHGPFFQRAMLTSSAFRSLSHDPAPPTFIQHDKRVPHPKRAFRVLGGIARHSEGAWGSSLTKKALGFSVAFATGPSFSAPC
jgi:hypothetical protein